MRGRGVGPDVLWGEIFADSLCHMVRSYGEIRTVWGTSKQHPPSFPLPSRSRSPPAPLPSCSPPLPLPPPRSPPLPLPSHSPPPPLLTPVPTEFHTPLSSTWNWAVLHRCTLDPGTEWMCRSHHGNMYPHPTGQRKVAYFAWRVHSRGKRCMDGILKTKTKTTTTTVNIVSHYPDNLLHFWS